MFFVVIVFACFHIVLSGETEPINHDYPRASNSIHQFPDVATGMRKWTVALLKKGEAQRFINCLYFAAPYQYTTHFART